MGAAPIPVSVATCKKAASVLLANIATSIPYRQYCFAHHSSMQARPGQHPTATCYVGFVRAHVGTWSEVSAPPTGRGCSIAPHSPCTTAAAGPKQQQPPLKVWKLALAGEVGSGPAGQCRSLRG